MHPKPQRHSSIYRSSAVTGHHDCLASYGFPTFGFSVFFIPSTLTTRCLVKWPVLKSIIYIPCCSTFMLLLLFVLTYKGFSSEVFGPESFSEQYVKGLSFNSAGMYFQTSKVTAVTKFYVCLHGFCVEPVLEVRTVDSVKL